MSVPSDTNVSLKIFENLSKYKDLKIEVTKLWHLKIITLPVVNGELGMVAKTVPNYVSQILRKVLSTQFFFEYQIYSIHFKVDFKSFSCLRFLGETRNGLWKKHKRQKIIMREPVRVYYLDVV